MEILLVILAAAAGAGVIYFVLSSRLKDSAVSLETLEFEKQSFQRSYDLLAAELADLRKRHESLIAEKAGFEANNENLKKELAEKEEELLKTAEKLKSDFENLATQILDRNAKKFAEKNQENLTQILDPLKERIKNFEQEIRDTKEHHIKTSASLAEQIKGIKELGIKMSEDAQNLTTALKGENKTQGNWGELILEKVLEFSGLEKGKTYDTQVVLEGQRGNRLIVDAVIYLPENKQIVIDSKVSLKAYDDYINSPDAIEKEKYLVEHKKSLKGHIDGLAEKHYPGAVGLKAPDFILMFMPIEACLAVSLQAGGEQLFEYAWKRKVVLVAPSTLLATLKTVASIWKYEHQNQNAQKIAEMGSQLYNQFVAFIKEMENIDQRLNQARTAYDAAMQRLAFGNQSLTRKADKLRLLGVNPKEKLKEKYIDEEEPIEIAIDE